MEVESKMKIVICKCFAFVETEVGGLLLVHLERASLVEGQPGTSIQERPEASVQDGREANRQPETAAQGQQEVSGENADIFTCP